METSSAKGFSLNFPSETCFELFFFGFWQTALAYTDRPLEVSGGGSEFTYEFALSD